MTTTICKSKDRKSVLATGSGTTSGTTLPFDDIREPGAFVCLWSGHLLRVPESGIGPEQTPQLCVIGSDPLMVTKIDDDPYVPVTRARLLAANQDIAVNF